MRTVDALSRSAPLWPDILLNIGCVLPRSKMWHHASNGCHIVLVWTNHISRLGARWTLVDTRPSFRSVFFLHITDVLEIWPKHAPLYYAAPCGFQNLVEELIVEHPRHVNARKTLPSGQVLYRNDSSDPWTREEEWRRLASLD